MAQDYQNYYDVSPPPVGLQSSRKKNVADLAGLGTRSCFSFRPPRTITTTSDFSEESHPSDEKRGLLYSEQRAIEPPAAGNSWSTATTAYMSPDTTTPSSSPDNNQLLAMPDPTDRSHRRRLQMQREGRSNRYGGEQEPPGYRGQERESMVSPYEENSQRRRQPSQANSSVPMDEPPLEIPQFLSMPAPMDRSHRRRLQMEREGSSNVYSGEQEPAGYRGQQAAPASPKQRQGAPAHAPPSPYLQFTPSGPSLRVFDASTGRSRKTTEFTVSPDSSLLEGDVEDRPEFAPPRNVQKGNFNIVSQSYTAETEKVADLRKTRVHRSTPPVLPPPRSTKSFSPRSTKSILKKKRQQPVDSAATTTTQEMTDWSNTPERSVLRNIMHHDVPDMLSTSSTQSSEDLRHMMTDLLQEDPVDDKGAIAVITDVNDMAEAAQQHVEEGEYDLALVLFGRILNIYRHEYGDVHPLVASAYHNLGMVHSQRAQLLLEGTLQQTHIRQQSLECFQAAARTARDSLGKNHPNVAVSLVKIGFLLLQSRQYQPAVVTFEEALRIRVVHYGNNPHPLVANLHNNLGVCLLHLHSFAESKQHLNMALEIQRHILRVERIKCTREELRVRLLEVADTLSNLGGLGLEWLRQEGPHPEVIEETEGHLAEALEIRTTVLGHEHPLAIQAKTLYEMIRSSMPPPETKSPGRGLQHSIHSNMQPSNPPQMRDIQVLVPSSNTASRDAPAPKFTSASPAVELEGLRRTRDASPVATRTSREVGPSPEPTKSPQSEPSRRTRRDPSPPVTEIVLADEEEPILAQRQSRDQTRVFVSQQYIPRRSPTRRKSGFDESYYSDPKTPVISSPSSESSGRGQLRSHAYDSEESCQLNESGDRVDVLSPFLFQIQNRGDDVEANLSLHEIVVVRPCAKVESDAPCPLVQPLAETMGDDWKGETKKIVSSTPRDNEEDDNDDGIAPLSRTSAINNDPKIHLSSKMMKNPNLHLADIHSVASRYLKQNRFPEALHLFENILDTQRSIHGELHEDVGAALHNVGLVHLRGNEYDGALEYFERAVRIRKGSLGRDHPEVAVSQVKVGITYLLRHEFDMALQAFLEALSIRKRALGALHPSIARVYNNIGCVHVEFNQLRDARRAFEAALDIQRNALYHESSSGALMFGTATTLCNLGYLYRYRDMHQKAALVLKEALSLQESVLGQLHPTVMATMDSLADSLSQSGGCAQALRYYDEILNRFDYLYEVGTQAEAVILYKMSRAHRAQNDTESELSKLQSALRIIRASNSTGVSEKKRKLQLERHILADIRRAREELERTQLDWI